MSSASFHDAQSTFSPTSSFQHNGDSLDGFDSADVAGWDGASGLRGGSEEEEEGPRYTIGLSAKLLEVALMYKPCPLSIHMSPDSNSEAKFKDPHLMPHLSCSAEGLVISAKLSGGGGAHFPDSEPQVQISLKCSHFDLSERLGEALYCATLRGAFKSLPTLSKVWGRR
jgi:hypothetical protein